MVNSRSKHPKPPAWANRFLEWFCAPELLEEVQGDIYELFERREQTGAVKKARWLFVWDVLRFFNLSTILGDGGRFTLNPFFAMYRNYIKITLRNIKKHKSHAFINIMGLAIGLAACLLIALFIQNELSFDGFHSKKDQVYRLCEVQTWEGIIPQRVALSMYPMGPTITADYPEVEAFTRLISWTEVPLEYEDKKIFIDKLYDVDSNFFEIFDFELLHGDPKTALKEPNSMLITEETALKYFEDPYAIGKQFLVRGGDTIHFNITGILKNIPDQSHLQFDGLVSISSFPEMEERNRDRWGNNWLVTYLKMVPGADIKALEEKFPDYLTKYMGEDATEGYQLFLQSLSEVHLGSTDITHDYQNVQKFDGQYITTFSLLALFVLLIAGINFMNLSTARSSKRAREIGVRKAIGATKSHISKQFIAESVIFSVLAMIVALIITASAIPALENLSHRAIGLSIIFSPKWMLAILGITLFVGFLAGFYPALVMAAFKPVDALKEVSFFKHRRLSLQNVLVVLQFSMAIAMIVGTMLATRQLLFMSQKDPGFNKEQVLLLPNNREVQQHYESLKAELLQLPDVAGVTASGQRLGSNIHQTGISYRSDTAEQNLAISHLNVDFNYIDFYEIELIDGREFSPKFAADSGHNFIINETLAKKLGWEDPVGKDMKFGWHEEWGKVVGLVKDFNYNSLHHGVNPLALSVQEWGYDDICVRVRPENLSSLIPEIEQKWRNTGTDRPFDYEFLDAHFEELYLADRQVSQIVGIVAGLAILVACMGLFGLISVTAERRKKEIGIRKVLGASVPSLLGLLAKNVALLVLIAFALAAPFTWWFMNDWLQNFTYRIEMSPWIFVMAGLVAMVIAMGTISVRALRAATDNPVESLRTE